MYFVPNFDRRYLITENNEIMTKHYSILKIWKNIEKEEYVALVNNENHVEVVRISDFIAKKQPHGLFASTLYVYPKYMD